MSACKRDGCVELAWPGDSYDGTCGRECQNMMEWYERGRDEERAAVVAWLRKEQGKLLKAIHKILARVHGGIAHSIEKGEHRE